MRIFLMIVLLVGCTFLKTTTYSFQKIKTKTINTFKEIFIKEILIESFIMATAITILLTAAKIIYNMIKGNKWSHSLEKFLIMCTPGISIVATNRAWDRYLQRKQEKHEADVRKTIEQAIENAQLSTG